jgi:hypothetical protein
MRYHFKNNSYICEPSKDEYQKDFLKRATQLCWDRYSPRLKKISPKYDEVGNSFYSLSNDLIVASISKLNPSNISLSVTEDGSLHYTIKFDDSTLFIETFLNLDQENFIYFELYEKDDKVISNEISLGDGLLQITQYFSQQESRAKFGTTFKKKNSLECDFVSK